MGDPENEEAGEENEKLDPDVAPNLNPKRPDIVRKDQQFTQVLDMGEEDPKVGSNLRSEQDFGRALANITNENQKSSPPPAVLSDSGKIIDTDSELYTKLGKLMDYDEEVEETDLGTSLENDILNSSNIIDWSTRDVSSLIAELTSESGDIVTKSDSVVDRPPNNPFEDGQKVEVKNTVGDEVTRTSTQEEKSDDANRNLEIDEKNDKALNCDNICEQEGGNNSSDDESEYVPSVCPSDSDFDSGGEPTETAQGTAKAVNSSCDSSAVSLHTSFNVPGNSGCNEKEQSAEQSRGRSGGQKKNFCIYCKKHQSKIARHLEAKHADEVEVQKFLNLPKKNPERKRVIAAVRKNGNFFFNVDGNLNKGKLIPVRRPQKAEDCGGENFAVCAGCRGFYKKKNLHHHYRECTKKKDNCRNVLIDARRTAGRIHEDASLVLRRDVFPVLRDDAITSTIRYDKLVILYGNKMCKRLRLPHQHPEIRTHLRSMGRFLKAMRKENSKITDMASIFDPEFYDAVVNVANKLGGLNETTQLFKTPSIPRDIGTELKKIGDILVTECIKNHDTAKKTNTKDFLKLLANDYGVSVNKAVSETMANTQRTTTVILPTDEDVMLLHKHLDNVIDCESAKLQKEFDVQTWTNLAGAIMIKLQAFNRRRPGETERITLSHLENRQQLNEDDDSTKTMTSEQKKSARKYIRITIRGKLNRTVPILMTAKIFENLQLLLKYREKMGVPPNNEFVFGIASNKKHPIRYLRACVFMRRFAKECGAKNPSTLRGTNLRKHIATRCVDMDLTELEISRVANFMGHHENIHRNIYRQPVVKADILEMSKVLEKAQGLHTSKSSENDTSGDISIDNGHGMTDSNEENSMVNDNSVASETSHLELTPKNKKRVRSDSENSLLETPEPPVPAKPSKSQKIKKKARFDFTPTQELTPPSTYTPKRKISPESSPDLAIASTSKDTRKRTAKYTAKRTRHVRVIRSAARSSSASACEKTPPTQKKKSKKGSNESPKSPSLPDTEIVKKSAKSTEKENTVQSVADGHETSKIKRIRWSQKEQEDAWNHFGSYVDSDDLPGLTIIKQVQAKYNILQGREPKIVNAWLSNQLKIIRNGGKPQRPINKVPETLSEHIALLFEEKIADGFVPSVKYCDEMRRKHKKIEHLSAKEIREIVKKQMASS